MAREMEREVCEAMDGALDKLASRCAVVDAGRDHAAFPDELARFYARMLITDARARY